MKVHDTTSNAAQPAAAPEVVAKPLSQFTKEEKAKITGELVRIHTLVSAVADKDSHLPDVDVSAHKDPCGNKAEGACRIEFKPTKA